MNQRTGRGQQQQLPQPPSPATEIKKNREESIDRSPRSGRRASRGQPPRSGRKPWKNWRGPLRRKARPDRQGIRGVLQKLRWGKIRKILTTAAITKTQVHSANTEDQGATNAKEATQGAANNKRLGQQNKVPVGHLSGADSVKSINKSTWIEKSVFQYNLNPLIKKVCCQQTKK